MDFRNWPGPDRIPSPGFCGPCGIRLRPRVWRFGPDHWPVYVCFNCIVAATQRKAG